jgi:hypothetical protein
MERLHENPGAGCEGVGEVNDPPSKEEHEKHGGGDPEYSAHGEKDISSLRR